MPAISLSLFVSLSIQSSSIGDMLMDCHLTPPCRIAVSPALRGPANFLRISSLSPLYSVSPSSASVTHAPPGRAILDKRLRFHFCPAFWISTSMAATSAGLIVEWAVLIQLDLGEIGPEVVHLVKRATR